MSAWGQFGVSFGVSLVPVWGQFWIWNQVSAGWPVWTGLHPSPPPHRPKLSRGRLANNMPASKVLAAHEANQKELIKLAAALALCGSTKVKEFAAADKRRITYEASSKSHKSCRSTEASLYTENVDCHKEWKDAKTVKELKCKAYLEISKKYGESQANQQIVTKAGSEDVESYLTRITGTICGKPGAGKPPTPPCGMLCIFIKHKKEGVFKRPGV